MVQYQGLDVYLAPFGDITRRYQHHTVPAASPDFTGDPNEVYIEAVDGERFILVVDVMDNFDKKDCKHLRIEYKIDQDAWSEVHESWCDLIKHTPEVSRVKGRRTLEESTMKVNGDWVDCGFAFSSLTMGIVSDLFQRPSRNVS
jgi:hypothetical protein